MNKTYKIVWNASTRTWVAVSEFARACGKRSGASVTPAGIVLAALVGTGICSENTHAATTTYTPGTANNAKLTINVTDNGTYSLDGDVLFTGSTGAQSTDMGLIQLYNAGYATGPVDPSGLMNIGGDRNNNGVVVTDPGTNTSITVRAHSSASLGQGNPATSTTHNKIIYKPTPPGTGAFINAQLANVSGGGTFNMNASGTVGDRNTKDTIFINVTNGTANWNSQNIVRFAGSSDFAMAPPSTTKVTGYNYKGAFTVTLVDGTQVQQTVNNLDDLKAYNTWLLQALAAGQLGVGTAAQSGYDNAFSQAYTTTTYTYTITPPVLPDDDPARIPAGTQYVMLADGPDAIANVSASGAINYGPGNSVAGGAGSAILAALNGGTAINNGTLTTGMWSTTAIRAMSGGHLINNGVINNPNNISRIHGTGTTFDNYGTINTAVGGWLLVGSGAVVTNYGAVNMGNTSHGWTTATVWGAEVYSDSTFINGKAYGSPNGYAGVIYLGRGTSADTTSDPMDRGGVDVMRPGAARGIDAYTGSTVVNDGQIIIGSGMQQSQGIRASGTNVNVTVGADGVITDKGNYPATAGTAPLRNSAIYSNATSGTVNNGGTINLQGANGTGLYVFGGGLAASSGTINVYASPLFASTGLRNYGIWSTGSNSRGTLTGNLNLEGDGAVGAFAENGGNVTVSGAGAVNFDNGTHQLGYYVYGPTASIVNTGTGTQNVSNNTANSYSNYFLAR